LSLDEAYLDVTANKQGLATATQTAKAIRDDIFAETGLTASAGVAANKFLAKVATEINKPNGQTVILPEQVAEFLFRLPVGKIFGVGPVTERRLKNMGIETAGDLQRLSVAELTGEFGKLGQWYYDIARGIDERPVSPDRERKSVSAEETFAEDYADLNWLRGHLMRIAERVAERLRKNELKGRTIVVKVKYDDFQQVTRSRTLAAAVDDLDTLIRVGCELLRETEAGERRVRLLGLGVSGLAEPEQEETVKMSPQMPLPF
jgi:DNA polymerase-4